MEDKRGLVVVEKPIILFILFIAVVMLFFSGCDSLNQPGNTISRDQTPAPVVQKNDSPPVKNGTSVVESKSSSAQTETPMAKSTPHITAECSQCCLEKCFIIDFSKAISYKPFSHSPDYFSFIQFLIVIIL